VCDVIGFFIDLIAGTPYSRETAVTVTCTDQYHDVSIILEVNVVENESDVQGGDPGIEKA
jgi:hypothetical protein